MSIVGLLVFIGITAFIVYLFTVYLPPNQAKRKGETGENTVNNSLLNLPPDSYSLLPNILLPNGDSTTQIDHIVVSHKGIFVIETKNYTGIISGSDRSSNWTETFYKKHISFKNPAHQNFGHVRAVQTLLGEKYGHVPVYSIIAFPDTTQINVTHSSNLIILHFSQIKDYLINFNNDFLLSDEDYLEIKMAIRKANIVDESEKYVHDLNAQSKKLEAEEKLSKGMCPKCGHPLVYRNGRYGNFIGCSNYPNCRYTHKL